MPFYSIIQIATHQLTSRKYAGLKIAQQSYLQSAYIKGTNSFWLRRKLVLTALFRLYRKTIEGAGLIG